MGKQLKDKLKRSQSISYQQSVKLKKGRNKYLIGKLILIREGNLT